jgi:LysM repeat protein
MMQPITPRPARRWLFAALIVLAALCAIGVARPGPALALQTTPLSTFTPTPSPTRTATATRFSLPTFTPGPSPTATLTPGPGTYVVQYGDTLSALARRFNVTVLAIKNANLLPSDTIYAGQVLRIPSPTPPTPTKTKTPLPTGSFTYTVQAGDQLLALARRFGVTASAIKSTNRLTSDTIYPGQVLVIPAPIPAATLIPGSQLYVVQPGDQLLRIARKFGVTLSALKAANGLTSDTIQPGQVLLIPAPTLTPTPSRTPTALPANAVLYVVKAGDRLARIAARYGVTMDALKSANRLASEEIYIGQRLVILNPTRHPMEYIVQPGDTLTKLAQRFGVTVEEIKAANGMAGDTILLGLILIIPVP